MQSAGPALRIISLIFLLVFAALIIAVAVGLAALPGQIAKRRQHPFSDAVNIAGWLGLPTGIVWVLAMVWAHMSPKPNESSGHATTESAQLAAQVQQLESLVDALEQTSSGNQS
ncbi:DUF3302 domain-containing protein [Rhodopirellula bahusiensis]|uniref:DUF3302 domain-containing protein n=1 Tax=Rhodopirellula bahusiensis TaxID=2014065 RepID=UPI001E450327